MLMADQPAQVFFTYTQGDDALLNGGISWLCEELQRVLRELAGEKIQVIQDADVIAFGERWRDSETNRLSDKRVLVPILSPSYLASTACRAQARMFLDLETDAGRQDRLLPIFLIDAEIIEDQEQNGDGALAQELLARLYADWRSAAWQLTRSEDIRRQITALARRIKAAFDQADDDGAPPKIPEQGPGVRFQINEDGLIDRAQDEPHDPDENEARLNSLKAGLIEACDRLLGSSGHNTLGFVLGTIRAYRSAIDQPLVDVQYTDVWRHGQRLQNLADAATREVDRLEPSLEDDQHAALNDLLDLHGPFMLSTAEGRALQAMADRYQATREQQEWQKEAVQAFKEAIEDSRGLVTDAAKQVIAEASDELGRGHYPERAAITAETTNRNFLSTAGKVAAYVGNHAAGGIIGGVAVSTALGNDLIGVSVEALNAAGQASKQFLLGHEMVLKGLVACSTDILVWLNHLIGWLQRKQANQPNRMRMVEVGLTSESDKAQPLASDTLWTPGRVFRDVDEPWCPEMVVIPAGEFMMGSPDDEEGRFDREGPQALITIHYQFALGRFPVTFDEYDHFCEEIGRDQPGDQGWGRGKRPTIHVSWQHASDYCSWLSEQTGSLYRLPSEAEWEYACRAGSTSPYTFGKDIQTDEANFGNQIGSTVDVGTYSANAFGLYDMNGNVWEWCAERYQGDAPPTTNKVSTDSLQNDAAYMVRGGAYHNDMRDMRSACRFPHTPEYKHDDLGFRCVRVLEQAR